MPYKDIEKQKDAQKRYYQQNKERIHEVQNTKRNLWRRYISEVKEAAACADCYVNYPYYVMDFDHRPGEEKLFEVGSVASCSSFEILKKEIAKCDIVCANCHRHRTFMRPAHKNWKRINNN